MTEETDWQARVKGILKAELKRRNLRWSRPVGQFSGRVKLGSSCRQAASLSVTLAPYASSGVRPANVE